MGTKTKRYIIVAAGVVLTLSAFLVAVLYFASKNGVKVPVKSVEDIKEPDEIEKFNAPVMPDVTGMNYEEAQELLEKFLSENDLKVRIIVGWGYNSDPSKSHLVAVSTPNAGKTIDSSTKEIVLMVYEGYNPPTTTTEETTITEEATTAAEPPKSTGDTTKPTESSATEESTTESEPTTSSESSESSESSDSSESSEETEATSSSEEQAVVMPDVVGMNYHDAMDLLEKFFKDNNLDIKIILGWGPNSDPNKNLLVSVTTPKAGTALDSSTKEIIMMVYEGYNPPE